MSLPVVLRRRFEQDLAGGYDWYESQRVGLGEELLAAIEGVVAGIERYGEIFAAVHGDVRRAFVPRFPFAIFYVVEPTRIVVLRMLHTSRDPTLWPRR